LSRNFSENLSQKNSQLRAGRLYKFPPPPCQAKFTNIFQSASWLARFALLKTNWQAVKQFFEIPFANRFLNVRGHLLRHKEVTVKQKDNIQWNQLD
jgi:hypothetical protein